MKYQKIYGLIITAIISMFFVACGGGSSSGENRDGNNNNPPVVNISMASSVKTYVGEQKTIPVTVQNTDFTVSVSQSGSGCIKSGSNIVCTPTMSGNYTVTATATADAAKKVSATVTVPELEILGGNNQTLYADDTESTVITFNSAGNWTAAASDGYGDIPAWLSLSVVSSLSVDDSDIQLYLDDFTQLYGGEDYDDAEVSVNAVSVSGGAGNNFISVTLQPNYSMADRTATITITTSTGQIIITITQRYTKSDGTPLTPEDVSISISPATASITVGTSRTFAVTRVNTADFTVSAPSAAGCVKNGVNAVICTPTAAGTYAVTVTATADTTKSVSATLTASAAVQEYRTVTFNVDGSVYTTRQIQNNSSLGLNMPSNPTKDGYSFAGWSASQSSQTADFYSNTPVTANITVYAIWQPVVYVVDFYIDGNKAATEHVEHGTSLGGAMPSPPTKIGYDFIGWNTTSSATTGNFYSNTPVTSTMTVYAIWQAVVPVARTVTFNVDGSVYVTRQTPNDSGIGANMPADPTKTGFNFAGWSVSQSAASADFYSTTPVTANITVYAIWQAVIPDSCAVHFNIDGDITTEYVVRGTSLGSKMPSNPTKTGYDFVGWNTNSSATAGNFTASTTVASDMAVYAIWRIKTHTVTFSTDGSTQTREAQHGSNLGTNMPPTPTKTGYDFVGWNTNCSAVNANFYLTTPIEADITVCAIWQAVMRTVTFNIDGEIISEQVEHGSSLGSKMPSNPTKIGYNFVGWNTNSSATSGNFTNLTRITENITVYAIWRIKTYTVSFNPDNGSANISRTVNHGTELGASYPADPFNGFWLFEGWFDSSNNRLTASTIITSDITVTARWSNLGDGSSLNPYIIITGAHLNYVRNNLSAYYKLGADINLANWNNWMPIGENYIAPFRGKIDGAGYKITGLRINKSSSSSSQYIGLFGYVNGGEINNLALEDVSIYCSSGSLLYTSSSCYSGGIAGYVNNSTISNSYSTGDISSSISTQGDPCYSGGIAGYVNNSTISYSYSTGDILSYRYSGGIAGYVNNSTISYSYSTGDIFAYNNSSGGIAGLVTGGSIISNSYSTGNISSTNSSYSGGIAGDLTGGSTISNSYSTGNITASSYSGGIAGIVWNGTISNSYSKGDINSYYYSGGIAGKLTTGNTISNSYSTGDISSSSNVDSPSGGIAGSVDDYKSSIINCVAINNYVTSNSGAGRIIASIFIGNGSPVISNNFALSTMTAQGNAKFNSSDTRYHGVSKTDAQLRQQSTYSNPVNGNGLGGLGWKFGNNDENPWVMPAGGGYPILYWQK